MSELFVSHAQNFEDVILWRALKHVENGTYVDVGAQDPVIDSVSLAFYERGWRGVHVDASPRYAVALRAARPDETVIEAAVGDGEGMLTFYEIPDTGLSTGDPEIAARHEADGRVVKRIEVALCTLDEVLAPLAGRDIHWLKIDVEGMEESVIDGWRGELRPWIVVVEATSPNTTEQTHMLWEHKIIARGYTFTYFDGLSRYYVSNRQPQLGAALCVAPNVFDNFVLADSSSYVRLIKSRLDTAELARNQAYADAHLARAEAQAAQEIAARCEELVREHEASIAAFRSSTSWRLTAPVRRVKRIFDQFIAGASARIQLKPGSRPTRIMERLRQNNFQLVIRRSFLALFLRAVHLIRRSPRSKKIILSVLKFVGMHRLAWTIYNRYRQTSSSSISITMKFDTAGTSEQRSFWVRRQLLRIETFTKSRGI